MPKRKAKKIQYRAPYEIAEISYYSTAMNVFIKRVELQLKRKSKELKQSGVNSENINDYLDSIIDTEYASIIRKYEKKYNSDRIQINNSVERRKSDKIEFSNYLSMIDEEIQSLSEEYTMLEGLYKEYNPLYNGRLNVKPISFNAKEDNTEEGDDDYE